MKLKLYLLIFPGFFWVAFSSGQNLPDLGDVSTDDLSSAQESILGAEIMRRVRTANTFVSDSEISQYLADLGYKLVSMSSDPDQRFEFFLVNDSVINAFALPGGYVGIHSGLVLSSKTESELAGVIAHEVAHVQQRHVARMLTAQKKLGVASLAGLGLAILASRSSGQLAEAALVASQAAPMHAMLRFSRDHEREADRVGLGIIVAAGFDPYATVDFFNELYRETRIYQNDLPGYLRTHPMTYERIGDLKSRLNSFEKRKIPSSLHYLLIKARVLALTKGTSEALTKFEEQIISDSIAEQASGRYGRVVVLLGLRTLNAQQLLTIENDISWLVTNYSNDALILAISANYKARAGQALEALREFDYSLTLYPSRFELIKGKAKLLMESNKAAELEKFLSSVLKSPDLSTDPEIFQLRAQAYLAQGILMNYHFDLSMVAYLSGNLDAAIRELKIAREQSDGDFYVRSQLDSRLNNLLREQAAIQN